MDDPGEAGKTSEAATGNNAQLKKKIFVYKAPKNLYHCLINVVAFKII